MSVTLGFPRGEMLRFLSKRGFHGVKCLVFSAKGAFPGWNASFSQKMGLPGVECFVFSENELHRVKYPFSQKMSEPAAARALGLLWGSRE
ncbi:hypothetical protein BHU16_09770 [Tannerella sp. oral taxon 808]|nr:hypothetical protein BHU16_09770 [Tannerella sp. oral taxon 808]